LKTIWYIERSVRGSYDKKEKNESETYRKELIRQVIETEANIARSTVLAQEKQAREEETQVRGVEDKDYELNDAEMDAHPATDAAPVNEKEASND
jgi:NADH-quinone oxidoreductase subunit M